VETKEDEVGEVVVRWRVSDRLKLAGDRANRLDIDIDGLFGIMADGIELVAEREPKGRGILLIFVLQKLPRLDTGGLIRNDTAVVSADEEIEHRVRALVVPNPLLGLSCIRRLLLRPINNIPNSFELEEDLDVLAERTPVVAIENSDTREKWIVGGGHGKRRVEVKMEGK
jgi:hypothetical protein